MSPSLIKSLLLVLAFNMVGCANYVQMKRDELRYAAVNRGDEEYSIKDKDSLTAAKDRAASAINDYQNHMSVYQGIFDYKNEKSSVLHKQKELAKENAELREKLNGVKAQSHKPQASSGNNTGGDKANKMPMQPVAPGDQDTKPEEPSPFRTTPERAKVILSDPDTFWPGNINKVFDHVLPDELIRGLSSTASMGQIRDLITEPEIPELLPINRKIRLGCLPPPDSAAFEAVTKLTANLERDGVGKAGISSEYADKVVKLFEESERTLFLQYALFRLCEMSVNTPSGFRNVFPVIMHDMVRRAAEMKDVATKEAEARRTEEEKSRQEQERSRQKEMDLLAAKQKAYFDCLGSKKDKDGALYTDETAATCRKQVSVDLSKKE